MPCLGQSLILFPGCQHHPIQASNEQGGQYEGQVHDCKPADLTLRVLLLMLKKACRRWMNEIATMAEATLTFRLPVPSLPNQESLSPPGTSSRNTTFS